MCRCGSVPSMPFRDTLLQHAQFWCSSLLNSKASNDLALWLYINKSEGLTFPAVIMGMIALGTNVPFGPGQRLRVSFAYNAANYYIGMHIILHSCMCLLSESLCCACVFCTHSTKHSCICLPPLLPSAVLVCFVLHPGRLCLCSAACNSACTH